MPARDKRHQEVIKKIKLMMTDISRDVLLEKILPVLDIIKVGYDNTVWSDEKRMLTIGTKTVQISPENTKKIPTFSQVHSNGKCCQEAVG